MPSARSPARACRSRPSKQAERSLSRYVGRTDGARRGRAANRQTNGPADCRKEESERVKKASSLSSILRPSSAASLALTPVARPRPPRAASHPQRRPCRPPSVRDCLGGRGWVGQSVPSLSDFQCHHHYHPSSPFTSPKSSSPC